MYTDASVYSTHRSMQKVDAARLVKESLPRMGWRKTDVLMDIGCGTGEALVRQVIPALPDLDRIIGIDIIPQMIEFALKNAQHANVEYHVADIENKSTFLPEWLGKISKVISIYCLHWTSDQEIAFRNIFELMDHEGEALILLALSTPFWDSYPDMMSNPKYNGYLKSAKTHIPDSHYKGYGSAYYRKLLERIGFQVLTCEEEKREYSYQDEDDAREASSSRCALYNYIPDELKPEFKEECFQNLLKFNGRDQSNKPHLLYTTLTVHLKKP